MKVVALALGLLVAACAGSTSPPARSVMVVDRSFDRAEQPLLPSGDIPAASYKEVAPVDRWTVAIEGTHIVLTPIGTPSPEGIGKLEGNETKNAAGERQFELTQGAFAGGRFVLRGDDAEVTLFGSGVPVVSSEKGKLVTR